MIYGPKDFGMNKHIAGIVLIVAILLPAFGEEIQIDESELIGTWEMRWRAAVKHDGNGMYIFTRMIEWTAFISFESGGLGKGEVSVAAKQFFWELSGNTLVAASLTRRWKWKMIPTGEDTILVLWNTEDSWLNRDDEETELGVVLYTMTRVSETGEAAQPATEDDVQPATDTGSFIDPEIAAAIRGADGAASSASETQPVARSEFSAGEDASSFVRESNPVDGNQSEIVYLEADGIEDLQRQRRILYRPEFDLPDDILSELAEGLPEIVVPVRIVILPTGLVMSVQILRSAGITRLDSLIIEDLRKWKFQPENVERNQTAIFPYVISATSG